MLQHQVFPLFDQRRRAVSVKRVLHDDQIMRQQQRLFAAHVDVEARIAS
jgi:hypothetical protein